MTALVSPRSRLTKVVEESQRGGFSIPQTAPCESKSTLQATATSSSNRLFNQ
jgi:hypothetical protein